MTEKIRKFYSEISNTHTLSLPSNLVWFSTSRRFSYKICSSCIALAAEIRHASFIEQKYVILYTTSVFTLQIRHMADEIYRWRMLNAFFSRHKSVIKMTKHMWCQYELNSFCKWLFVKFRWRNQFKRFIRIRLSASKIMLLVWAVPNLTFNKD